MARNRARVPLSESRDDGERGLEFTSGAKQLRVNDGKLIVGREASDTASTDADGLRRITAGARGRP
ncbi:MAG: hypothetical protein K0S86_3826 [Geminicoccaceae bacterium]|jgi:hypothetical protein|nr:hypothetical protein [Geminicoccaceae bacterium]